MTDVVKKGAGRASASRRTRKHAQKDVVVGGERTEQLKAALAPKQAKGKDAPASPDDYHPKVIAFRDAASAAGWNVLTHKDDDGTEHVTALRANEELHIFWLNGVYQRWAEHTVGGGKPQRVPNAKSGLRVLEAAPGTAKPKLTATKSGGTRSFSKRQRPTDVITEVVLPFDPQSVSEEELHEALSGRTVFWTVSYEGLLLAEDADEESIVSARVSRLPKSGKERELSLRNFSIKDLENGERVVTFVEDNGGFRSCKLSNIVEVK